MKTTTDWIISISSKLVNDGYDFTEESGIKILNNCIGSKFLKEVFLENKFIVDQQVRNFAKQRN